MRIRARTNNERRVVHDGVPKNHLLINFPWQENDSVINSIPLCNR